MNKMVNINNWMSVFNFSLPLEAAMNDAFISAFVYIVYSRAGIARVGGDRSCEQAG